MAEASSTLLRRLLPSALAWRLTVGTMLRRLVDGLETSPHGAREFTDDVYDDLIPETTRALAEWETQFGITPSAVDEERRAALRASWLANGGQSAKYIEDVLRAAGFDVYVYECWISPGVARDPRDYTQVATIGTTQCGDPDALCGEPWALCNAFLANDPHYIVNERMTYEAPPPIPDDPATWPYFLYVGGTPFGTPMSISMSQRAAFEELLLRIRPVHLWIVELITWFELVTVDGEIVTVDGDFVFV